MKIAFKKHSQNPDNDTLMINLPWVSTEIDDDQEAHYLEKNWAVLTKTKYEEYLSKYSYESTDHNIKINNEKLRIFDLVHHNFRFNEPSKIDFTLHLQTGVLLKKEIEMLKNGRPKIARYYHPDTNDIVAEIKFIFVDNAYKFMISREEWLGYYNKEGNVPNYYMIHKRYYNFNNISQATESMNERVSARNNIIQEIKMVINNSIATWHIRNGSSPTTAAGMAIITGKDFLNSYRFDVTDFVEVASNSFKLKVSSDTMYSFLDYEVTQGFTIRNYITDRLTY